MSDDQYVLWFIGMAVMIALILGLGTLVMSGVLRRPQRHDEVAAAREQQTATVTEHHHWYDRFHHAA